MASSSLKTAIVLGGGGARGAYEAGVISFLRDELEPQLNRPLPLEIVTGTSVGGIHACFLAGTADERSNQSKRLVDHWLSLEIERVLDFGLTDVLRLLRETLGSRSIRSPQQGALINAAGLRELVCRIVPWRAIRPNLKNGSLEALAISATHVATGRTTVFIQRQGGGTPEWGSDPNYQAVAAQIGPKHALASAAIPVLFPSVMLKGQLYVDGGLRLNVPLSPALRLGAERVIVISLRAGRSGAAGEDIARRAQAVDEIWASVTAPFLLGKALNALMLDSTDQDLSRLRTLNHILEAGTRVYGPSFPHSLNAALGPYQRRPVRYVRSILVRPSRDLGTLAAEYVRSPEFQQNHRTLSRRAILRLTERESAQGSDLASYLLFDGGFARHLIDLGRQDARARREEWVRFWSEEPQSPCEAA